MRQMYLPSAWDELSQKYLPNKYFFSFVVSDNQNNGDSD